MNFGWGRAAIVAAFLLSGCGQAEPVDPNAGKAEAVSFGRAFIANPDLVERIAAGVPLARPDYTLLYSGEEQGYTDYPTHEGSLAA